MFQTDLRGKTDADFWKLNFKHQFIFSQCIGTYQGKGLFENDSDKKILLIGLLASLRGKLLATECNKINSCSIGKISDKYKYEAFWWRMIMT